MGVVNVTPDSFSDGGRYFDAAAAVDQGLRLIDEGADILDIGGESTRPGSDPVEADEELRRVVPVIEALRRKSAVTLSIDTTKYEVAEAALDAGADIVNDISGLRFEPRLAELCAARGAGLCLMHSVGTPKTMQADPHYEDLLSEVCEQLLGAVGQARSAGVGEASLLVDPGIGFGKTLAHNLELLRHLDELHALGPWLLVGPSRKRFIGALTGRDAEARDFGTAGAVALCAAAGVHVIRVHAVAAMRDVSRVAWAIAQGRAEFGDEAVAVLTI